MKEWHEVLGDTKPPELDTSSSPTTVYQRRNIQEDTIESMGQDGEIKIVKCFSYEERELTLDEYQAMKTPAIEKIMQAISDTELNLTAAMVENTEGGTA